MKSMLSDPEGGGAARRDPFAERVARTTGPRFGGRPRVRSPGEVARGLGWKAWFAVGAALLVLGLLWAAIWPPLDACRTKAREIGLYTGDSVEKCTWQGIHARLNLGDQALKKRLRGSGE